MTNQINPLDALMGLQKPDGSIGGTYANPYSTAEAIIGLSGIPLSNFGNFPTIHRAGLVVFWGDNSLFTTCISFTESSMSGLDLTTTFRLGDRNRYESQSGDGSL